MQRLFFDIETPNRHQNRICQIGFLVEDEGNTICEKVIYINPEAEFDDVNMKIHHITPNMVRDSLTFKEVWPSLVKFFQGSLVVGHNICSFDLSVLGKCIADYGFEPIDISYLDTYQYAKNILLGAVSDYKLDTLINFFKLPAFDHHDALEDAKASRNIFYALSNYDGGTVAVENTYSLGLNGSVIDKRETEKLVNELKGLMIGLAIDQTISDEEIKELKEWLACVRCSPGSNQGYYGELLKLVEGVIADNYISFDEYNSLMELFEHFAGTSYSKTTTALQVLEGVIRGIILDNKISKTELENLSKWMSQYEDLVGTYPFNKVSDHISKVLEDGIITSDEELQLLESFKVIINPVECCADSAKGAVDLDGKKCCLTGSFISGTKDEVATRIESMGGEVVSGVSKKTDVLIVGGQGSEAWAYGNYGGKIKRALELQEQGIDILIVGEKELFGDE